METIRNYLENMFMNLPNSAEVIRAKQELLQMMEDKYTELKEEGKTENEAVGIVISDFGNLEELADDLGIDMIVREKVVPAGKNLSMEEIKNCLRQYKKRALLIALGVALCISSPSVSVWADALGQKHDNMVWLEVVGNIFLFAAIAIAVVLFIFAGEITKRWEYMQINSCNIDFQAAQIISDKKADSNGSRALQLSFGIVLCILSVVPVSITEMVFRSDVINEIASGAMFVIIALGVFMIVHSQCKATGYSYLLSLNNRNTIGGNYVKEQKKQVQYTNPTVKTIMSVFWPTVTCIYLSWSFLTFDWWITWIIWPLASFIEMIMKASFGEN